MASSLMEDPFPKADGAKWPWTASTTSPAPVLSAPDQTLRLPSRRSICQNRISQSIGAPAWRNQSEFSAISASCSGIKPTAYWVP